MINKSDTQPDFAGKNKDKDKEARDIPYWIFTAGILFYVLTAGWNNLITPFTNSDGLAITGLILLLNSVILIDLLLMVTAFVGFVQMSRTGWVFLRAVAIYYLLIFLILNLIVPGLNLLPELFPPQEVSSISILRWIHVLFFVAVLVYYQFPGTRKAFNLKSNDSLLAGTLGIMLAILQLMLSAASSYVIDIYMELFFY